MSNAVDIKSKMDAIRLAEEMLAEAKEDYKQAAMLALEEGRLEEIQFGNWREIYSESATKVYCDKCFAYAPNALKLERCPHCGARMKNALISPVFVERPKFLNEVNETAPVTETVKKEKLKPGDKKYLRAESAKQMLHELRYNGFGQYKTAKRLGVDQSSISAWERGKVVPREKVFLALCDYYKECFGKEFVLQ